MFGTSSAVSSWGRVFSPLPVGGNLMLFGYTGASLGFLVVLWCYLF